MVECFLDKERVCDKNCVCFLEEGGPYKCFLLGSICELLQHMRPTYKHPDPPRVGGVEIR